MPDNSLGSSPHEVIDDRGKRINKPTKITRMIDGHRQPPEDEFRDADWQANRHNG